MHVAARLRPKLAGIVQAGQSHRGVLWGLVLAALGLRLIRLTFQPLWWDEGWSLYFATADVRTLLQLTAVDIHPPLYYLILRLWIQIFGSGVVSVRLLSVLIGTATVLLLYPVGKRLLREKGSLPAAALAAVGLLAISPFHIYYSQEVRMYGLVTLFGLAAWYFAWRWESGQAGESRWRWLNWTGYVLAAAAALYTQYYAAFLILALNLVVVTRWLRSRPSWRERAAWLGAQAAVFLLFLPWLWYAGTKLLTYVRFKVGVERDVALGPLTYLANHLAAFDWGHAEGWLAEWWWLGLLPLAVLGIALAVVAWSKAGHPLSSVLRPSPLIIVVITLACGFLVNLALPFNPPRGERLLLLSLPAYLILVTIALWVVWRRRHRWAVAAAAAFIVAAIVSLSFFYTVPRYPNDDYRPVAERVQTLSLPSDAILCVHPWQVGYFQAYLPDDETRPALVLTPREVVPQERQFWADDPAQLASSLDALLAEHGRLWFADHRAMGRVLEEKIEAYLVEHAYPTLSEWYGDHTVLSFFATGETAAQPVTAQFSDWLTLESAALSYDPLEAGWGVAAMDLTWRVSQPPDADYTVGLRLVDPRGFVWAQRDAPPRGGLEPFSTWPAGEPRIDRHGLLVPAGTPPGDYLVKARVYRSDDLTVLPVTYAGGSGGEVTLGTVHISIPETPPPVEALPFGQPLEARFGDRLQLVGVTIPQGAEFLPGEAVPMELFWQALANPGEDFLPRLQLLDAENRAVAELTEKPVSGTYPTAWWHSGQLVRDPHALAIPATVPAGRYRLALSLIRAADGQPVEFKRGQTALDLGDVEVQGREHRFQPTAPAYGQVAHFGTSVELTGYDLPESVYVPGSPLEITLHWHALETPDRNYYTFVHLLDADGVIVAQDDGPPAGGEAPPLGWLPGEYLTDTHRLQLPAGLPDGEYRLEVGLYDPATQVRLGEAAILDSRVSVRSAGGSGAPAASEGIKAAGQVPNARSSTQLTQAGIRLWATSFHAPSWNTS
jgi:4-amino-4-deoxy-L-arabinose transferase-like glycosyltransferase